MLLRILIVITVLLAAAIATTAAIAVAPPQGATMQKSKSFGGYDRPSIRVPEARSARGLIVE